METDREGKKVVDLRMMEKHSTKVPVDEKAEVMRHVC